MNDINDVWAREDPASPADDPISDTTQTVAPNRAGRRAAGTQKARIAAAIVLGGVAGAAILGPLSAMAASPSPAASGGTVSGPTGTGGSTDKGPGGIGGHNEAVSDTSVVAKAIGISEADLQTALQGGQTVAAVAKAHNVDLQVVIDALVADGQSELDAAVKAGTITQAQADAEKANLSQRATDQANGSFQGGPGH